MSFTQFDVEQINQIQFIKFRASELTSEVIDAARPEMLLIAAPYEQKIVLDLSGVRFLGSAALGLIVQAALLTTRHRGRFVLAAPHPDVYQILTGPPRMMRDIPVYKDRDAAVRSFSPPADRGT